MKKLINKIFQIKPLFQISQVFGVVIFSIGLTSLSGYMLREPNLEEINQSTYISPVLAITLILVGIILFIQAKQILILDKKIAKHEKDKHGN